MLGAILGDIIGSPYEFTQYNIKTTNFPLFNVKSHFTDDTVMTAAVAQAILNVGQDEELVREELMACMREYGRMYLFAGYGQKFFRWLIAREPKPYGSYGNGSAMRVSPVAWLFDNLKEVELFAKISAEVTHNHPEGIKGAQATATAIFLARQGESQATIKKYVEEHYGYDLDRTPEAIHPEHTHVATCQETVPIAIIAFLHSTDFESAVRLAVSLGGDSDTLAAITGSIAEAAWGIPEELKQEGLSRLDERLLAVYLRFTKELKRRGKTS